MTAVKWLEYSQGMSDKLFQNKYGVFLERGGLDLWLLKNIKEIIFILLKKKIAWRQTLLKLLVFNKVEPCKYELFWFS